MNLLPTLNKKRKKHITIALKVINSTKQQRDVKR